jgi:hypothetical protein
MRLTPDDLEQHFRTGQENIGLLLGEPSRGLLDVDLDVPEAIVVADRLLPSTERIHGRPGNPRSHRWYVVVRSPEKTERFKDLDGTCLLELRSTGSQTLVPPSLHPSGELLVWESTGEPCPLEAAPLRLAVGRTAAATLLSRHYPAPGGRHEATLALAGTLLKAGWTIDETVRFVLAVAAAAGDDDLEDRRRAVADTAARLESNGAVTGPPTLGSLVGSDIVTLCSRWLGLASRAERRLTTDQSVSYDATSAGLVQIKLTRDGTTRVPLTTFDARIVTDIAEHDGVEVQRLFEIEARLNGRTARFTIPARDFPNMAWPAEHLGVRAVVHAGSTIRDHARAAIQLLSDKVVERRVFTHTGWIHDSDAWWFLHGGGAIGAADAPHAFEVKLPELLAPLQLPSPPGADELVSAVRATMEVLRVAPLRVTVPLLCATHRAPLGNTDFSLYLVGPSGAGKSELAALAQQHFGAGFDRLHLPGSWSSTANANEALAFTAKDALLTIDDFAPGGTPQDVARLHREADRLIRAQGNRAGRQRMRADTSLRPAKPPRGLFLITGEDVPRLPSVRARMAIIELRPDDLDWARLTDCQADADGGLFATAMAGYLRFCAARYEEIQRRRVEEIRKFRDAAHHSEQHRRTATVVAQLAFGGKILLEFWEFSGAISSVRAAQLFDEWWRVLGEAAADQQIHQASSDPVQRFLELLRAALASGQAHVAYRDGTEPPNRRAWGWQGIERQTNEGPVTEWRPQGARIGWIEDDDLLLEPEAAFTVAQRGARDQGDGFSISPRTLRQRLAERRLLRSTDEGRARGTLTVRWDLEGARRSVLHLAADILMPQESDQPDHAGQDGDVQGKVPGSVQRSPSDVTSDQGSDPQSADIDGDRTSPGQNGQDGQDAGEGWRWV